MTENPSLEFDFSFLDENYKRITENINEAAIKSGRLPESVRLMAVTKTVPPAYINHVIGLGADLIGENKVQELIEKLPYLNADSVEKHIIGHLQSNKVKKVIDVVSMIQSVDSISLAEEISRQAKIKSVNMDVLLEVNIGKEESKTGFLEYELAEAVAAVSEMENIHVRGLMAIPPICDTEIQARKYFSKMYELFEATSKFCVDKQAYNILSMGMSADYASAICEGATLVRVGNSLFGKRKY